MRRTSRPHRLLSTLACFERCGNWSTISALLLALLIAGLPVTVSAQTPRSLRIPPVTLPDQDEPLGEDDELPELAVPDVQIATAPRPLIIDTDPGVDDAAALIWLFSQNRYPIDPLGIVTVAGNTSVDNATNNVFRVLDWLGRTDITVIKGSEGPLLRELSQVGVSIHGPDGLWGDFLGYPSYDISDVDDDPIEFYCNALEANPNALVLALGPLTNLARAIEDDKDACPESWQGVEIVSLLGAKFGGNQTPVTEYNAWQDPDAAEIVLANTESLDYTVTMVPYDAFKQFTVRAQDLGLLEQDGVPAIQNLLPALVLYGQSLGAPVTLADVAAAIYALDNRAGDAQEALVKVLNSLVTPNSPQGRDNAGENKANTVARVRGVPNFARGQTVVGLDPLEQLAMIATDQELSLISEKFLTDPDGAFLLIGQILLREPTNALFVTDIRQVQMYVGFLEDLTTTSLSTTASDTVEGSGTTAEQQFKLYVPMVE